MRPLRIPLLAAALGILVLAGLFSRVDPSAQYRTSLDRNGAIQRARQISALYGVDTGSWKAAVTELSNDRLLVYRSSHPKEGAAEIIEPVAWGVLFMSPNGGMVRVKLFGNGRAAEWELKQPAGGSDARPTGVDTPESALQNFAGDQRSFFAPAAARSETGVERQAWEWKSKDGPFFVRFEAAQRSGRLVSAVLDEHYGSEQDNPTPMTAEIAVRAVGGFVIAIFFCMAVYRSVAGWARGRFTWRAPLILLALMLTWGLVMVWAGPDFQAMQYSKAKGLPIKFDSAAQQTGAEIGFGFAMFMRYFAPVCIPFLSLFVFAGAGYAAAKGRLRKKWDSFEWLVGGKLFRRQVSLPIAAGALCGIAMAAAPYLVAMLFRKTQLLFHARAVLSSPVPATSLVHFAAAVWALGYMGWGWPWAVKSGRPWLRYAATAAFVAVYLFAPDPIFHDIAPSVLTSAIVLAITFALYRKFDLLAVTAATMMAWAMSLPCILLVQPVGTLRESGIHLVAILGAAVAVFVNFAVRGEDAEADEAEPVFEEEAAESPLASRSNRKRLEAEFQVARRAQEDALSAVPAGIEGYSFAASCDPAQQVGGDLYDFFPLPDGRMGIAVADVSGKGVPAALYMMVTKGLLTATAQNLSDPGEILRQINGHLYRACKRKVFVTLAAVFVTPGVRRIEYARAGHNPVVWRRVRMGQTELVKPGGVGLGMCKSETFGRSLRIQEMDLESGDAVVLYSDGVTEAINGSMEQYGEERLMRAVEKTDGASAAETRAAIIRDLEEFAEGTPARDDVTVVVLRVA